MPAASGRRRWLFADQLGPEFLDDPKQPVLLIESKAVFRRRTFHRQKAHLILSALRHRAADLGDQAIFLQAETYREALKKVDEPLTVCSPTSRGADRFVRGLENVEVLPERGYGTTKVEFAAWAAERGGRRLLMEDFYRNARLRHGLLMDGDEPAGGKWNLDHDNREPPPRTDRLDVREPYWPVEDAIDEQVRADLDRWEREDGIVFVGADGPRLFAATRKEALAALRRFLSERLPTFGPYEDAMLADDWTMAHSLLSAPMNLGLISPVECAQRAEQAYRAGDAPLPSVEGYIRQLIGWRDYIWNIYWHVDEDLQAGSKGSDQPDYRYRNFLDAHEDLPAWFADLDADAVEARCLSDVLRGVRDRAWVHHIPRLMVLGNYALQRGWNPEQLTDWFHRCFVDGYDWVMLPNIVGMSQHADGGLMATKPYASGGAYINRMSDYCSGCAFEPSKRVGEDACPYTAGYWWFLARNEDRLRGNARMRRPLQGLRRLKDVPAVVAQEEDRGSAAPRLLRSGDTAADGSVVQLGLHEQSG